jgi:nitroimidazol reductase NimA-like FMN-containing flavoprotein (pyridoxamine 5'-phosphate oxidase superfamily)
LPCLPADIGPVPSSRAAPVVRLDDRHRGSILAPMVIHELSTAECEHALEKTTIGWLGCARDNQPYIVPISIYFDRDARCLYSFATVGQKIDWMRGNPRVCVAVDEVTDPLNWTTVLVTGRYDELVQSGGDGAASARALELFQRHPDWWLPGTGRLAFGDDRATPVVYRITIDQLTGRRTARPQS